MSAIVAYWFPSIGSCGIVLAVVAFLVSLVDLKGKQKTVVATLSILLGVGEWIAISKNDTSEKKKDDAHRAEVTELQNRIADLKAQAATNEIAQRTREAHLTTELNDYIAWEKRLGPYLAKLGEASKEYARKQYETKQLSDKELYAQTMDVVKRIREFSSERQQREYTLSSEWQRASAAAFSDPAHSKIDESFHFYTLQLEQEWADDQKTWARRILGDAAYCAKTLDTRIGLEPNVKMNTALDGSLAGAYPERELANALEEAAKRLSIQGNR